MAQFGRPISDISIGPWTDNGLGVTNLWSVLDDNNDVDYIEDLGGNGTYECTITSLIDPISSVDHIMRSRIQGTGSGGPERCACELWQGTDFLIATTGNKTSRGSWTTFNYTLSAAEADSIIDYTSLRFKVISSNLGGAEIMWHAWSEIEIPDAAAEATRRIFIIT